MSADLVRSGKNPILLAAALSIPAILEQLLVTATSYVDTAMVGSLGAGATAAISVTASCNWLINGVIMALGVGYSVRTAYFIGAGVPEMVRKTLIQSVLGSLILGVGAMLIGSPMSFVLPGWMGAAQDIRRDAFLYMLVLMIALPGRTFHAVFSAILRCMGNTRTPMIVNTLINLLNVVLNFFLIYSTGTYHVFGWTVTLPGAGLGVFGAAIATGLSLLVGGVWLTAKVLYGSGEYCPKFRGQLRLDGKLQKDCLSVAIPVALERITISFGQIIMTRMVSTLGTVSLAANYVAVTAEQICYMPAYGIASASTALVGQNVGAGQWKQAKFFGKVTGWIGVGLTAVLALAMFLWSDTLGKAFSSDLEVALLSGEMLRIVSVAEPMFSMSTVMSGALRGAGEAKFPFYVGIICMLCIRVTLGAILLFGFHLGLSAVWIAMAVDLNLRGIANYVHFIRSGWIPAEDIEQ